MKPLRFLLFFFIAIFAFLIGGCSSTPKLPDVGVMPTIDITHPEYKTTVIPYPIDLVKAQIVKIAKAEGFKDVVVNGNTITVTGRKVEYDGKANKAKVIGESVLYGIQMIGGAGYGGAMAAPVVLPLAIIMGASQSKENSSAVVVKSSNGIAHLKEIDGKTQLSLNFVRIYYKKEKALGLFGKVSYIVETVDEVNDPKVYEYAFRKLKGEKTATLNEDIEGLEVQ